MIVSNNVTVGWIRKWFKQLNIQFVVYLPE